MSGLIVHGRGRGGPRPYVAACLLVLGVLFASETFAAPPTFDTVIAHYASSEGTLRARDGSVLALQRLDREARRLAWTAFDDISPAMIEAVLAAEDQRFYAHSGVDWAGAASAAWDNLTGGRVRGASSITMQLAGLLDPALARGDGPRTLGQKWDQIGAARELEKRWNKQQILEAYLNLLTYRGELQGIHAASRALFDKHPSGLNRHEASLLAALIRAPQATPAKAAARACHIAQQIHASGDCGQLGIQVQIALRRTPNPQPVENLAPHLARRLLSPTQRDLTCTLDKSIQTLANDSLQQHLRTLAASGVQDGAVVVLDNASGEVLAYIGSSGPLSLSPEVDGANAPRQAGSTLKPFLYALAFDRRLLTAATLLDDAPYNLSTAAGLYVPQNYEHDFKGPVSVRTALGSSLNIPAVRTVVLTGVPAFHEQLRALGFSTLVDDPEHYGFSLALGAADVTLLDLSNAFRTLANGGRATPVTFVARAQPKPRQVISPQAAFIIGDILADRGARFATFGFDNPLAARSWSASKTGTSKDMRDNWAVGYSDRYTVGVWVGNFSGSPMHDVSGVTGAAPIWSDIMNRLHATQSSRAPRPPAGVTRQRVAFSGALDAARSEWFLRGTESGPLVSADAIPALRPRILYPANGSLIAIDPAIPASHQGIPLKLEGQAAGLFWKLDEKRLAPVTGNYFLPPSPGRHHLVLETQDGTRVDEVEFEVRGHGALATK